MRNDIQELFEEAAKYTEQRERLAKALADIEPSCSRELAKASEDYQRQLSLAETDMQREQERITRSAQDTIRSYQQMKKDLGDIERQLQQYGKRAIAGYVPDPNRANEEELRRLIRMIQETGIIAWIKRTFSLGGYSSRDNMAYDVRQQIADGLVFCERQMDGVQARESREKQQAATDYRRRSEAALETHRRKQQQIRERYDQLREQAEANITAFNTEAELSRMHQKLKNMLRDAELANGAWGAYTPSAEMPKQVQLCSTTVSLPDTTGNMKGYEVPVNISLFTSNIVILVSRIRNKADVDTANYAYARRFLARMLKSVPTNCCGYSVLDPVHKGTSIGRLIDAANAGTGDMKFELFCSEETGPDGTGCNDRRKFLTDTLSDITKDLAGRYDSLYDFNRERENYDYPFQWIVDYSLSGKLSDKQIKACTDLFVNAQTGGYSFLLVTDPEGAGTLRMLANSASHSRVYELDCDSGKCTYLGYTFPLREESSPTEHQIYNFMTALTEYYTTTGAVDNRLAEVFRREGIQPKSADKKLSIPMALNRQGKPACIELGGEGSVHAFISGGTNSGKSTLLHTIILSACLHYSPEELEIWMADYKQTEFFLYKANRLPQVKLVGISKTKDFTYSLLERINKEGERRSELFRRYEVTNLGDYRKHSGEPDYVPLTRLLVVIDEFHEMSQMVADEPAYKDLLENILREYRAQGINFILADQTFSVGLKGLSEPAKNQIGVRIAMRNEGNTNEIRDTLNVDRALYSDQVTAFMNVMRQGEFLMKTFKTTSTGKVSDARLEEFKGFLSTADDVRSLAKVLRRNYKGRYRPDDFVYVDTKNHGAMNYAAMDAVDEFEPLRHNFIRLYMGAAATIRPCFNIDLGCSANENLAIVGGLAKDRWSLAAAAIRSCCSRDVRAVIFLAEYSDLDNDFGDAVKTLCADCGAELACSYSEWCSKLKELESIVNARVKGRDIVCIFLGLETARDEMSRFGDAGSAGFGRPSTAAVNPFRTSGSTAAVNPFASSGSSAAVNPFASPSSSAAVNPFAAPSSGSGISSAAVNPAVSPAEELEFNALPIIELLFDKGPRTGIRCVAEVSAVRTFSKLLKLRDVCRHKIALSMSGDDCLTFLGRSSIVKEIGNDAVYNDGGKDVHKLVPYLLEDQITV